LNKEVIAEAGLEDEILYFMRSGGLKSKDYQQISWAGDQAVDWTQSDGLMSSITAALSLACGGMGMSHSDIGGYTGTPILRVNRDKELLLRWAEYSAFTPLMRTHEGNHPEANWQVYTDRDTMDKFARTTNIYARLGEAYIPEAVLKNFEERVPVMRPLFMDFEMSDPNCFDVEYQYMFGDDLLVAPVTEQSVAVWDVYLPAEEGTSWVWLWDEQAIAVPGGQKIRVGAPLGFTPVFYKAGSKWTDLFVSIRKDFSNTT